MSKRLITLSIILLTTYGGLFAQFYNGLQQSFGKNRVQYEEFTWKYLRNPAFDVYFYENGRELAYLTEEVAKEKLKEYSLFFDFALSKRIQFIIYNNLSDFRQSNIGLISGVNRYNIGGVTKILKNKVFIYFTGDRKEFKKQISAAIAEVFINEMIFGTSFTARMASATLMSLPEWYLKGLISYLSNPWDEEINNKVKNGILSGKFTKINRLIGEDAVVAGHSIWYYIASRYGKDVIPNILYLTKTSKNIDSGFMFVLGTNSKYLSYDWQEYFEKIYNYTIKGREFPPESNQIKAKTRKPRVFQELKVSNDGNLFAYTSNQEGQYRIKIYNKTTGKTKKILKKEHKLAQITDYSYPLLAWHPSNEILAYLIEEKGSFWLNFYDLETKKTEKRELFGFDKITSISYSNDGKHLAFSAVRKGQSDIFIYNVLSYGTTQLTKDIADDFTPSFTKNDKAIVFSSNRDVEELNAPDSAIQENTDVFLISLKKYKATGITRITNSKDADENTPFELGKHKFILTSNKNGINNKYLAKFDSSISFIDTVTHYRYFTRTFALSDYAYNINSFNFNNNNKISGEIMRFDNKFHLYNIDNDFRTKDISNTYFKNKEIKIKQLRDSLKRLRKHYEDSVRNSIRQINTDSLTTTSDTNNIDINNYKFDISPEVAKLKGKPYTKEIAEKTDSSQTQDDTQEKTKPFMYFTNFYINDMVSQIDFSFLSNSYQAFTGSGFYYNPGFNMFFKLGAMDLFEDYKITGAFRFAGDFDSNEWLISIENLKKRLDKQLLFHRQTFQSSNASMSVFAKTNTHILNYILKYPFSQVSAVRLTLGGRTDRTVYQATDSRTLMEPNVYKNWANIKLEYIFDNSRELGVNLYTGNRIKLWGEAYKQIDEEKTDLFVLGFDFRHYEKIHRNLIFASRVAGSTSFGQSKLIYYLGSVDNWMNFSTKNPTFNSSVQIDYSQNWAFQAVATNMRGFSQNIRNGNSFVVINNELRWPVFKYFANRPLSSDFINNFQVIGFFDIGTAWTGTSPYSRENKYNQEIRPESGQGPIVLIVDKDKNPIVYGYGFGLRSRLLGYFIRADWAWGVEDYIIQPKIFYLSLSLDF